MKTRSLLAITAFLSASLANPTWAVTLTFSASGPDPSSITPTVDAFRASLGLLNPNNPVSFPGGRREINWDGVPDGFSSPNSFPGNFFNGTVPGRARGVEFTTPGTGFQVSANAGSGVVEFGNIDPSYPGNFQPFSAQKLFTPIGSTITDVSFFLPGTQTPALTSGFGAVFADVDAVAQLAFYDSGGNLLASASGPTTPGNEGLSFLGLRFDTATVARVRITSGNSVLAAGNTTEDLVVLDDFIFGEPQGIPDSAGSLLLLSIALAFSGLFGRHAGRRELVQS